MSEAPNRAQRQACYVVRDAYFQCLEDNNEDIYKCKDALKRCEEKCPKSWIKHFEKTRERLMLNQKIGEKFSTKV